MTQLLEPTQSFIFFPKNLVVSSLRCDNVQLEHKPVINQEQRGLKGLFLEMHTPPSYMMDLLRYTREIPESAPFLYQHGAQIGGLSSFSYNKNNYSPEVVQSGVKWKCKRMRNTSRLHPLYWLQSICKECTCKCAAYLF